MTALAALAHRYWNGELRGFGAALHAALAPAEALFRAGVSLRGTAYDRTLLRPQRASIPVVSIGNIAVGGAGKTPFTNYIARRLHAAGRAPVIVHGGYAADEPELHRRWSAGIPVIVDRDRVRAAHAAAAQGADVVVLDDAFQHRRLARDLDIVLIAAERFTLPLRMLPRGPWREPLQSLRRAGLVVVTRKAASAQAAARMLEILQRESDAPLIQAHLFAQAWLHAGAAAPAPAAPALAVCAIADPQSFLASARNAGATIADSMSFTDHYDYSAADAAAIRQRAAGKPIVTTEKDWTKLDRYLAPADVWILTQTVVIERGGDLLQRALMQAIS